MLNKEISNIKYVRASSDDYGVDEQTYLQDLENSEVLENKKVKLKGNKKIFKGQVNELITKYAEKNNTITLEGDKININPEKIPSNADMYPYTLSNVDKEVYEKPFQEGEYTLYTENPKDCYINYKEEYLTMKKMIEQYFNIILNIDYTTVSAEKLYEDLSYLTAGDIDNEILDQYVSYVKTNKIKLNGQAKTQMPIVYYDGVDYRVRTKINLNVEQANTDKNLLLNSFMNEDEYQYKIGNNEILIDAKLEIFIESTGFKVSNAPLTDMIIK